LVNASICAAVKAHLQQSQAMEERSSPVAAIFAFGLQQRRAVKLREWLAFLHFRADIVHLSFWMRPGMYAESTRWRVALSSIIPATVSVL
jgi:hypothetical protein